MTAGAHYSLLTIDEFLRSGESDGFELIHGEPQEINIGVATAWLVGQVFGAIADVCHESGIGTVVMLEAPLAVWPDDPGLCRKPGVMFYQRGTVPPGPLPRGAIRVVPDLIVEVVSPHDEAGRLEAKLIDYRRAGVPLIWVIFPETQNAHVHRRGMAIEVVEPGGTLASEDILPGFHLNLATLFEAAARAFPA